jgi:hypothetical protein
MAYLQRTIKTSAHIWNNYPVKQSHSREVNFYSARYDYYGVIVATMGPPWVTFTINCEARTNFRGEFRMTYNDVKYFTK